jgi:putative phage-type endonuclease
MTARLVLPADAPRDEWLEARRAGVTASEIAALLGISPYESPFDLYWKKTGEIPEDYDNDRLSLGRHLEPWLAERFAASHPELVLQAPVGLWCSLERPWQLVTPDGLVYDPNPSGMVAETRAGAPLAVWEGKTSGTYEEWGETGTNEVPPYIAAQVLYQMDAIGVDVGYVSCLFLSTQQIRTYRLAWDQDDVNLMRARAAEFWQQVQDGRPPEIDGHTATTLALKRLYPDVDEAEEAQVPDDLATRYRTACTAVKQAEARKAGVENEIRAAMGNAKRAITHDGQKVATRSVYERKGYEVKPARIDALKPATSKKKEDAA